MGARAGRAITGAYSGEIDQAKMIGSLGGEESAAAIEQVRRYHGQSGATRQKTPTRSAREQRIERNRSDPEPTPNQPPDPVSYRSYGALPDGTKQNIRAAFVVDQGLRGGRLSARESAQNLRELLSSRGINVPITTARVQHTNEAMAQFQADNDGRLPKVDEYGSVFGNGTLAIPPEMPVPLQLGLFAMLLKIVFSPTDAQTLPGSGCAGGYVS